MSAIAAFLAYVNRFTTDDLHCGLKKNIGCSDVIFAVKLAINYFVELGGCVLCNSFRVLESLHVQEKFRTAPTIKKINKSLDT